MSFTDALFFAVIVWIVSDFISEWYFPRKSGYDCDTCRLYWCPHHHCEYKRKQK